MISFKSYLRDCGSALSAWAFPQLQVALGQNKQHFNLRTARKKIKQVNRTKITEKYKI